jgi:hypothetical protein
VVAEKKITADLVLGGLGMINIKEYLIALTLILTAGWPKVPLLEKLKYVQDALSKLFF